MEQHALGVIEGLVDSRNTFFDEVIGRFRREDGYQAYSRFMINEMCALELINRLFLSESRRYNRFNLTLPVSIGENSTGFNEPVIVAPTDEQVRIGTESVPQVPENSSCAICQESIAVNGMRIRECQHLYHDACLRNWFLVSVRCPMCRHDIREGGQVNQTLIAEEETTSQ